LNYSEIKISPAIELNQQPVSVIKTRNRDIACFTIDDVNIDIKTVDSFGDEWKAFHHFDEKDLRRLGDSYFDIITPAMINEGSIVADFGCGSGRWTKYISNRAGHIAAIDPSDAIFAADELLSGQANVSLFKASISNLPFNDNYFDFAFSLGVLHHIPDTAQAMKDCVRKVKKGGYFLVYLYYDFEDRGFLFKTLYRISNAIRKPISRMRPGPKKISCDILAVIFYMPFVLLSRLLRFFGVSKRIRSKIPLHGYESTSFYIIRNDSLDRFGTPLEQRFSKKQIEEMMKAAGLDEIVFGDQIPFWHAVGRKL
jgi:SAM-dependent methyltransferase